MARAKLEEDVKKIESDSETEEIKEAETSDVEGETPVPRPGVMTSAEHAQRNWERREKARKENPEMAWASLFLTRLRQKIIRHLFSIYFIFVQGMEK